MGHQVQDITSVQGPQAHIEVGAIWSRLTAPADQVQCVFEALCVDIPGAEHTPQFRRGGWDGTYKFLRRPDNRFLAGLTWRVAQLLVTKGFTKPLIRWPEVAAVSPLADINEMEEREYEIQTVERAILRRRMLIAAPTGSGKTEIGIEIARRLGRPTLWLTHRKELLKQTAARFRLRLGVDVGIIGAGKASLGTVTIATVQSLRRLDHGLLKSFGVVIADEAHHAGADSWQDILLGCEGAHYRFGLTGTPDTGNIVTNMKIEGALGPTYRVASTMQLATAGYLAKPTIVFLKIPSASYPQYEDIREQVCPDWRDDPRQLMAMGGQLYRAAYEHGVLENKPRNEKIREIALAHVRRGEKFLILVHRIPHVASLLQSIQLPEIAVWGLDGGCSDVERQFTLDCFKKQEGGGLLIATPFFREGVDIPQIDAGMLAGGGEAEILVLQGLGRMLRRRADKTEVIVYDFLDGRQGLADRRSDKDYLLQHTRSRLATYKAQEFPVRFLSPGGVSGGI